MSRGQVRQGRLGNPIRRSDGMVYPSCLQAAKALAAELGAGVPTHMASDISCVANGVPGHRSAYGYGWEWLDAAAAPCQKPASGQERADPDCSGILGSQYGILAPDELHPGR